MAIRNRVWGFVNRYINARSEHQLGFLTEGEQLSQRLQQSYEKRELGNQRKNLDNYTRTLQPTEFEKQKFDVLSEYNLRGRNDPRVNPDDVLLKFDKIQVLQNLKMIEENEQVYDPERIRYEKLKARVILEEPGAQEEYLTYVKERPYITRYELWNNQNERQMNQYIQ